MTWGRAVASPARARAALASPGDELWLRAAAPLDEAWAALGFAELVPGEPVRPVPLRLASVDRTRALGARLAAGLRAGDLVVLSGPMGAGKTALTQGIGAALGVRGAVTSPTFVLARQHPGQLPLVHVDAYRLREAGAGPRDVDDLDLDSELPYAVTVVEWGDGLVEHLTDSRLHVRLERPVDGAADLRTVTVTPYGPRWSVRLCGEAAG